MNSPRIFPPFRMTWLATVAILAALAAALALASQPAMTARAQSDSPATLVSNMSETASHDHLVGRVILANHGWATAFTTGSHSLGYTLSGVTAKFNGKQGTPGAISAKIWSSAQDGGHAKPNTEIVTLSGSNPDSAGDYTYTCSGSGCQLSSSTTYHLAFEAGVSTYFPAPRYKWRGTSSDNQTSGDGWTIADSASKREDGGSWTANANANAGMFSVAATKNVALTASGIATNGATLALSGYSGDWYYKQTAPAAGDCSSSAISSGETATLSDLTIGTAYTFKAYSDSACNTEITGASADFTTLSTLTASNIAATGATLTLAGHSTAWRYKYTVPAGGQCSAEEIAAGTATATLSDLDENTSYTFKAYSDNSCNTEIAGASATFTTLSSLTASNVTGTGATLTLAGHTEAWRYKYTVPATPAGQCSAEIAAGTATATPPNLTPGTSYTFKAYSDSSCNTEIGGASATFTTLSSLTASGIATNGATLALSGYSGDWYYKQTAPAAGDCSSSAISSGETATLSDLTIGTAYTFKAYSDSACNTEITGASADFTTLSTLTASNIAATGATLTLAGHSTAWRYKYTVPAGGQCSAEEIAAGTATATLSDLDENTSYTFKAYSDSSCNTEIGGASAAFTTLSSLTASNVTGTGATLTLAGHTEAWRYKYTVPATPAGQCSAEIAAGTATATPANLTPGTSYTFKAYSDSACNTEITGDASDAEFTTIGLSASNIAATGARLTLKGHSAAWYYKQTAPAAGSCSSEISAGTSTADVTGLTPAESYTFKAYSDSACSTEITSDSSDADFTAAGVSVGNLGSQRQ